uniref:Bifunctional inhibitor/plant lipid transfer protein/seed storage helical domain-containing protein n=1 Tax=Ananas comosus var. bracteatus TaxID=296719 RepID=A0A6V7PED0_ANACO|nr:unnamed protein product [Ananas comosus var. bracteatus]
MERARVISQLPLTLTIFTLFSLLRIGCAQSSTFCLMQFALANQACAVLPVTEDPPKDSNQMKQHYDDNNTDDDDGSDDDDEEEDEQEDRHGHGHSHGHGHGHGHKGRHEGDHREEPRANRDCCRWIKEVDKKCVCEVLLRLPTFLTKPKHKYSISVGSSCKQTYRCGGA